MKWKKRIIQVAKNNTPRWLVLLIDLHIVSIAYFCAFIIRNNFDFNFNYSEYIFEIPLVIIIYFSCFIIFSSYKGIIRHTGIKDATSLLNASTLALVTLVSLVLINKTYFVVNNYHLSFSIIFIHYILSINLLITSRFLYKRLYDFIINNSPRSKRTLIYGTGETGTLTFKVLNNLKKSDKKIIGFIDNHKTRNRKINGLKVYHESSINLEFMEVLHVDTVIIAINSITSQRLLEISDNITKLGVEVQIVPSAKKSINGGFDANQIRPVRVEDLLGRAPIQLANPNLSQELKDRTILVTGAAGSIGGEISRQLAELDYGKLILLDQAESDLYDLQQSLIRDGKKNIIAIVGDVRNLERLESKVFKAHQPKYIYHAAAYKHVPFMEENPYESVLINVFGTKHVAELASKYDAVKFVMVSTDKAVNPTNVMGATKRIAEIQVNLIALNSKTKFIVTRFGNVLGSNGSVIPLFKKQIENGGPLSLTHKDITRYFMTIPEACQLVLEAGTMGHGGEVFVFDMGKSVRIYDLAVNMIRLSGLNYPNDIDIKITGLRPGEKLYEELLSTKENTIPTHNKKILIAKVNLPKNIDLEVELNVLKSILKNQNDMGLVKQMKLIVPEFKSNNSIYEKFDRNKVKVLKLPS
ncbi:MAG: polysaccharide biosynthesis protein [Flavobacteriaceae bacterium]